MKPVNHTFEDGFESWVRAKQYADLNADELNLLRSEGIDEAAYTEIRTMLLALDTMEEEPVEKASDAIKDKLLEAFDRGPQKQNRRGMIFWIGGIGLAAAAAILLFFYVLPGPQGGETEMAIRQSAETLPNKESQKNDQEKATIETTSVEQNQTKSPVSEEAQEALHEDISLNESSRVIETCTGLPTTSDIPSDASVENADDFIAGGSVSGTSAPAVEMPQTAMEKMESKSKGKEIDNQRLTTAMIDWLVTVY
jgi:hypothetical protein